MVVGAAGMDGWCCGGLIWLFGLEWRSGVVATMTKVRAIKNWGFCIDRNAEKLQSWKQKMASLVGREVLLKAMAAANCVSYSLPVFS